MSKKKALLLRIIRLELQLKMILCQQNLPEINIFAKNNFKNLINELTLCFQDCHQFPKFLINHKTAFEIKDNTTQISNPCISPTTVKGSDKYNKFPSFSN